MAHREALSELQVALLRWVSDGCPDGALEDRSPRISAAALQRRDLVRITGCGPRWMASLTEAGKEYLRRVDGPNPLDPRQANVSVTQQLVDDIIAAGGRLQLPRKHWGESGVDYERRARLAQTHGKVPPGSRLSVKARSRNELLLELIADPHLRADSDETSARLSSIAVPGHAGRYHPVAREFRNRVTLHEVSRKALPRVVRIVHALASEAERRGYSVSCVQVPEDRDGASDWRPAHDGQLVFIIRGHHLPVRIWESGAGLRGPYERQLQQWQHDREQPVALMQFLDRPKPYDKNASGELNIEALAWSNGRQHKWTDRTRFTVEDRLPNLLWELELQAADAEQRQLEKEREQADRQRQWEAAMERAKQRLIDDHRLEILRKRIQAWQEAEAIRAYCDAVEQRHRESAAEGSTAEWLALARQHADRLQQLPAMPANPEPTPERLKPYLGNWSPHGPQRW